MRVEGEVEAGVAEAVLGAVEAIHGARINLEVAEVAEMANLLRLRQDPCA